MEISYHIKKLHTGEKIINNVCVKTTNSKITNLDFESFEEKKSYEYMIPGFIDLQIYGADGSLLMEESNAKTIKKIHLHNLKSGTFFFQPTIASISFSKIIECINAVKDYKSKGGEGCIGLHVEGPWINPKKNGAHSLKHIHSPKIKEVEKILSHANGNISMITLAPEVVNDEIIDLIQSEGIIISIGHSNLDFKTAKKYINRGLNAATHLFNAMPSFHHRNPGLVLAILNNKKIYSSIICDGHHVDFKMIKHAFSLKKDKLFSITDAVTESSKGEYTHKLKGEIYQNNGILSGSSITMHESFKNLIQKVGLSFNDAVNMCCSTPSKIIRKKILIPPLDKKNNYSYNILDKDYNLIKNSFN